MYLIGDFPLDAWLPLGRGRSAVLQRQIDVDWEITGWSYPWPLGSINISLHFSALNCASDACWMNNQRQVFWINKYEKWLMCVNGMENASWYRRLDVSVNLIEDMQLPYLFFFRNWRWDCRTRYPVRGRQWQPVRLRRRLFYSLSGRKESSKPSRKLNEKCVKTSVLHSGALGKGAVLPSPREHPPCLRPEIVNSLRKWSEKWCIHRNILTQ